MTSWTGKPFLVSRIVQYQEEQNGIRSFLCSPNWGRVSTNVKLTTRRMLGNADVTIVAQSPKMAPHLDDMKKNLALDLDTELSRLNIKATTTEKLGFAGRKEGIAVHAVVLLESIV